MPIKKEKPSLYRMTGYFFYRGSLVSGVMVDGQGPNAHWMSDDSDY
jgi:hypothetical protein